MEVCEHTIRVSQQSRVRCQLVRMSILNVMIIYSPSCRPSVCLRTCLAQGVLPSLCIDVCSYLNVHVNVEGLEPKLAQCKLSHNHTHTHNTHTHTHTYTHAHTHTHTHMLTHTHTHTHTNHTHTHAHTHAHKHIHAHTHTCTQTHTHTRTHTHAHKHIHIHTGRRVLV